MTLNDFNNFVSNQAHETIYDDSEGRRIVVIRMLDLFAMVNELTPQPQLENKHG